MYNLQESSRSKISEDFLDMVRCGWGSGQVVPLSLESVLIGRPLDAEIGSIGGERVRSLGNGAYTVTDEFLHSALFHSNTVISFETVSYVTC